MSEDINFGAITEALNDKADRDLNNTNPVADYVVERYDDGAGNWYEVWKSGRLRQGGIIGKISTNGKFTVTTLKPFANNRYSVVISTQSSDGENEAGRILTVSRTITTTGFVVTNNGWSTSYVGLTGYWIAEGQGA